MRELKDKIINKINDFKEAVILFREFNKEEKYFAPFLAFLIFQGKLDLENVPTKYRDEVEKLLEESTK